jgi:hypothetical protein
VVLPPPDYEALTSAIKDACAAQGALQPTDYFVLKVAVHALSSCVPAWCTDATQMPISCTVN